MEIDGLLLSGTEAAADRGPALAIAVVADLTVAVRGVVEFVLDVVLLERARGNPPSQPRG